jgi:hypothetical protein
VRHTKPPVDWVSVVLLLGVKHPGYKADHLHPPCAKFRNEWSCIPIFPVCLRGMHGDNFTLPFT